jgi:hypothetical protein
MASRPMAARRDDADLQIGALGRLDQVRVLHRTRVKRGDLVVVLVGDDDRLRRVELTLHTHERGVNAPAAQPRHVVTPVAAQRGHDHRRTP